MQPAKKVKNGKELHMQEVMFVDPSATMKLVPWEEHVDTVAAGNTYSFEHTGVKKDKFTKEILVNTAMSETKIT